MECLLMSDLLFVGLVAAFFALTALVVKGVERLWASRTPSAWPCPSCLGGTSRWPCSSRRDS